MSLRADVVSRVVTRNAMLRDGTPRREKGYRAIVETLGPDVNQRHPACGPQKRYCHSPLFDAERDAQNWIPEIAK